MTATMVVTSLAAAPVLVLIALEDVRNHRIRNRHLVVLGAITAVGLGVLAANDGRAVLVRAAIGSVLAALPLVLAALVQPSRMGGGDIKLALVVGALLGGVDPVLSVAAVGVALVVTLAVLGIRRGVHGPLAPGLVVCTLVILAAGVTFT